MSPEELESLQLGIDQELTEMALSRGELCKPVLDGVVDAESYLRSSPKLMWILKEPWEEGEIEGNWSVPKYFREGEIKNVRTYRRVAYVSHCALNYYPRYSVVRQTASDRVWGSLKNIAFINVKKFPGKSKSYGPEITAYYRHYQALLLRQLAAFNPDVVIGGYTLHLFCNDLGLANDGFTSAGTAVYWKHRGCLYINAYHPGYWRIKDETYINDLVALIKAHGPRAPLRAGI
jgi:hypothetical protein